MLGSFEDELGVLVNGAEFFDVKGKWPVAFTLWRHVGENARPNTSRSIPLIDLTWLTRDQLASISWEDQSAVEEACGAIMNQQAARLVEVGRQRESIQMWVGQTMTDFKRDRRKDERGKAVAGGLPRGDPRQANKKTYGEPDGKYIGFMDDLAPCRVKRSIPDKPWFRLNSPLMDIKKNRCFSGPPDQKGFCATSLESAKKLFFWYALTRILLQHPYPMWVDSEDLWEPTIPEKLERPVFQTAIAIGYAENECVETSFPANNPIAGAPQIVVGNPLTPLSKDSFWTKTLKPYCDGTPASVSKLTRCVDVLFAKWADLIRRSTDLYVSSKPYSIGDEPLTLGAGLVQIRDYAKESGDDLLLQGWSEVQTALKAAKTELFEMISGSGAVNYFGTAKKRPASVRLNPATDLNSPPKTTARRA